MRLENAAEGFFEAVNIVGDGAEEADLAFGAGFSDSNGDGGDFGKSTNYGSRSRPCSRD
jgi:hypothetical protein